MTRQTAGAPVSTEEQNHNQQSGQLHVWDQEESVGETETASHKIQRHNQLITARCDRLPPPSLTLGHSYFCLIEREANNTKHMGLITSVYSWVIKYWY